MGSQRVRQQRANSLKKTLMLRKIESRRRGRQRMRWLDGITDSMDEFEQAPGDGEDREAVVSMGSQRVIHN